MTSTDHSSRFNPFKFAAPKDKPPPLPPKDPIYQQRTQPLSRASLLSPPPDSPLSPSIQYAIRRANSPSPSPLFAEESIRTMSRSSPELLPVLSIDGSISDHNRQTTSGLSIASKKDKALAFLKFPKKSPRSPPSSYTGPASSPTSGSGSLIVIGNASADEPDPPPPQEDDGISLPWNFQHNIHVDEGYVGLPPSWSTSLASAGFTEEEIAALQARRAAGVRSPPDLRYLYNERPRSPAVSSGFPFPAQGPSQTPSGVPILTHPTPRTTSLNPSRLASSSGLSTLPRPPTAPALLSTQSQSSSPATQRPPGNPVYGSTTASSSTPSLAGSLNLNLKPNPYYVPSPASTSNPNRIPPPKRKPPMPVEELESPSVSRPGHRPNQPSSSTIGCSTDSHGFGTSDSHARPHHNHSASQTTTTTVSVSYGSHSQSKSNLSQEDDDDIPLARVRAPVRQNSESTFTSVNGKASLAGGTTKFRVVNGSSSTMDLPRDGDRGARSRSRGREEDVEQEKRTGPGSWGSKIFKATTGKSRESPSASNSVSGHSSSAPASSSDHSNSHSNHTGPSGSSSAAGPSTSAASSPWSSVVKQSSNLVEAMKTSAGKGIGRIRSKNGIKEGKSTGKKEKAKSAGKKDKVKKDKGAIKAAAGFGGLSEDGVVRIGRDSGSEDEDGSDYEDEVVVVGQGGDGEKVDSDEEFASLPPDGEDALLMQSKAVPVWQIYSRPRAATDASQRSFASASGNAASQSTSNFVNSSSASGSGSGSGSGSLSRNLSRKASNPRSLRSTGSHGSLRSRTRNLANASSGSLHSLGGQHKASGSMTSLESIPEVSPPPLPEGTRRSVSLGRKDSGKKKGKGGVGVVPQLPGAGGFYAWSEPPSAVAGPSGSGSSSGSVAGDLPPTLPPINIPKRAPALPPRLSLHQLKDSSDLTSWSEALLSGISLGGESLDLGFSFGLGKDESRDREREKERGRQEGRQRGEGKGKEREREREREKRREDEIDFLDMESPVTVTTATMGGGMTARPWEMLRSGQLAPSPATATVQPLQQSGPPERQQPTAVQPQVPLPPQPQRNSPTTGTASSSSASSRAGTPPTQPRLPQMRKAGQPLPTSKPPPSRPIPPIVIGNPNGVNPAPLPLPPNPRLVNPPPPPPSGLDSPAPMTGIAEPAMTARPPMTPLSAGVNKPLPPVRPVPPLPGAVPTPIQQTANARGPDGLLSPPVPNSAWSMQGDSPGVMSPAGSSNGPDSAQLWNEIEQMMDPNMISSIPGLHLSVALPPGAQGVLRSAGVAPPHGHVPPPLNLSAATADRQRQHRPGTVGEMVGTSPPAVYSAALTGGFSPTIPVEDRVLGDRTMMQELDVEEGDSSMFVDEQEGYDGIVEVDASPGPEQLEHEHGQDFDNRLLSVSPRNSHLEDILDRDPNRDSSRSSSSTLTITALAATTIVRNVSIARRTGAYVIDKRSPGASPSMSYPSSATSASALSTPVEFRPPSSPLGSQFGGSEESSGGSGSMSSSSQDPEHPTPTTDGGIASPLTYYLDGTQTPSPTPDKMAFPNEPPSASSAIFNRLPGPGDFMDDDDNDEGYEPEFEEYPDEETMEAEAASAPRPTIVISDEPLSSGGGAITSTVTPETSTPLSPFQRYRGWLSDVVAPLEEFIDEAVDPRDHYLDLSEIAEGESGSVFAAVLNPATAHKLRLPPLIKAQDTDDVVNGRVKMVAIKSVAIVPSGSPKLVDLQRELSLMRGLGHENVLGMDGVYVDLVEDSLWVRMELMERSLADIIGLVGDGLQLQERTMARFTSDVLCALDYLQKHNIAHRDVRSDNLLINKHGVLKLADFSNAVQVTKENPMRSEIVGVPFWQAPEVRRPPYNAMQVDVWSLGATVWEMAQQDPPFADTQQLADRWPSLRQPELYSPAFHDFLKRCSDPASSRSSPAELLKSSFIVQKACGRQVIVLLLSQCMAIEKLLQEGNAAA